MSLATLRAESKKTVRRPVAKVRITWTDPLIDPSIEATANDSNRVSYPSQVADLITEVPRKWFHTNDPDVILDGSFYPMPSDLAEARTNQVGFWSQTASDENGGFLNPISVTINFSARPVYGFVVAGDSALGEYSPYFTVTIKKKELDGSYTTLEMVDVIDNDQVLYSQVLASGGYNVAHQMVLNVHTWSKPNAVVKISEFYSSIIREYGPDDIISLSITRETESAEGTLPIGNISADEMDLTLQNLDDQLFPSNTSADLHTLVKRNRKMEPSLGFEYEDGSMEFVPWGLYWSGDWSVPEQDAGASVSGRDRMELFRKLTYEGHSTNEEDPAEKTYWANIGLKDLLIAVLTPLLNYMPDLVWDIDDELNDTVIPYAFFKRQNYFQVIKQIASSAKDPAFAFMDTPTDAEKAANVLCADVLRVKTFSNFFGSTADPIVITMDDYITKNLPAKSEEIINTLNVIKKEFVLSDDGIPEEVADNRYAYTTEDTDSVKEFGVLESNYDENDLIQTEAQATAIGQTIVPSFAIPRKDVELDTFGDVTLKIGDVVEVPEYQKNGIDVRGIYAIKKLNAEYDGSLRIKIEARKGAGVA